MNVTLLLHDAVLTKPGSYTARGAPSVSLILPRSAPLTAPFSIGTSYSWPVRLSRTVRESFTPSNLVRGVPESESGSSEDGPTRRSRGGTAGAMPNRACSRGGLTSAGEHPELLERRRYVPGRLAARRERRQISGPEPEGRAAGDLDDRLPLEHVDRLASRRRPVLRPVDGQE